MTHQPVDEPLHMTVYSLPPPQDVGHTASVATGRWTLLAIMLVSSIPVCLAYFAYWFVQPQGRAGLGEFISPARPVGQLLGQTLDNVPQPLAALKGRWLLVSVAGGACADHCQKQLFIQRQLWATLGNEKDRVGRLWLIDDQALVEPALRQAMGDAVILRVSSEQLSAWLGDAGGKLPSDFLFLVDPLGNAMLRFPGLVSVAQAGQMHRDLDRLLRATASWTPVTH